MPELPVMVEEELGKEVRKNKEAILPVNTALKTKAFNPLLSTYKVTIKLILLLISPSLNE